MALIIECKVVPKSGRNAWKLEENSRLKCYLKNPAEQGKANQELIGLFSKQLGVPRATISILTGLTSKIKRIKIDTDITFDYVLKTLGLDKQLSLFEGE